MPDSNLVLRDTLRTYMNHEVSDKLKSRWLLQRKHEDTAKGIQVDQKDLEKVLKFD